MGSEVAAYERKDRQYSLSSGARGPRLKPQLQNKVLELRCSSALGPRATLPYKVAPGAGEGKGQPAHRNLSVTHFLALSLCVPTDPTRGSCVTLTTVELPWLSRLKEHIYFMTSLLLSALGWQETPSYLKTPAPRTAIGH